MDKLPGRPFQWNDIIRAQTAGAPLGLQGCEDDEEPTLTLSRVINDKPSTKTVREFFRQNLASIKSEEQMLFESSA